MLLEKEMYIDETIAISMVNHDHTGLTEEEIDLVSNFEKHIVILEGETEFTRCELTELMSDCLKIACYVPEDSG